MIYIILTVVLLLLLCLIFALKKVSCWGDEQRVKREKFHLFSLSLSLSLMKKKHRHRTTNKKAPHTKEDF